MPASVRRIAVTSALPTRVSDALKVRFETIWTPLQGCEPALFANAVGKVDALVVAPGDPVTRDLLEALRPELKVVASYSVGVDHIDLDAAKQLGVMVTNTPDVLTDATADLALLLLLAAVRGLTPAVALLRSGSWTGWAPDQVWGRDLAGLTLGIFGYGRIGRALAARAAVCRMKIVAYAHRADLAVDRGIEAIADLDRFWGACDVISLHAPTTAATRGIVNRDSLSRMRDGVIIVNTGRGDLVDDEALIEAARCGKVGAIGLDVFAGEPKLNPDYLKLPNAVLLPHIGSGTLETREAMGRKMLANLEAIATGSSPPDRVA